MEKEVEGMDKANVVKILTSEESGEKVCENSLCNSYNFYKSLKFYQNKN